MDKDERHWLDILSMQENGPATGDGVQEVAGSTARDVPADRNCAACRSGQLRAVPEMEEPSEEERMMGEKMKIVAEALEDF